MQSYTKGLGRPGRGRCSRDGESLAETTVKLLNKGIDDSKARSSGCISLTVTDIQGSGKTLAYSLPILSHLLAHPLPTAARRPLSALVLCPTRELALQVVDHLQRVVKHIEAAMYPDEDEQDDAVAVNPIGKGQGKGKGLGKGAQGSQKKNRVPRISIGSVVGGLSAHKQKRIVDRGADVLVATPGRLWDLIKSVGNFARLYRS